MSPAVPTPAAPGRAAPLGARRLIVPANGLSFEVFEAGEGDRGALLLHGFPQHALMWRRLMQPLAAAGYRVWAVNQRGYGGSSRRRAAAYGLDALASDLVGLIDAAGGASTSPPGVPHWGPEDAPARGQRAGSRLPDGEDGKPIG